MNRQPLGIMLPPQQIEKLSFSPIGKTISGYMDKWGCPTIELRLFNDNKATGFIYALIDTGAYHSYISKEIADRLGIKNSGWQTEANNPMNGNLKYNMCLLQVEFEAIQDMFTTMAFGIIEKEFNYHCIIGTQFLSNLNLQYFGKENRFLLEL